MDGNGRWARQRGLPRAEGHRQGVGAVRRTVQAAIDLNIPYLTIYSFSSENWSRPKTEISELFFLLKRFIRQDLADLHKNGVRLRIIGERGNIDPEIDAMIEEAEALTKDNHVLTLVVAFNYGARSEIVHAARKLAKAVEERTLDPDEIDHAAFENCLDTHDIPDPDLLIRTSGEMRLSNFLLWQLAYSEFMFTDVFWPDFGFDELEKAVAEYGNRERRYGGLTARSTA